MNKNAIEYFKTTDKGVIIKEKSCPERFLSVKEFKVLQRELKRTKKWERISLNYSRDGYLREEG